MAVSNLLRIAAPLLSCLSLPFVAGCAHVPPEDFHPLAKFDAMPPADQQALRLPFDAYVLGLEKDNASRIGRVSECPTDSSAAPPHCLHIGAPFFVGRPEFQANLRKLWDPNRQRRPIFVSHVARFDAPYAAPCFLYNMYSPSGGCSGVTALSGKPGVATSWDALASLRADLARHLAQQRTTHVLIYSMGWNTDQREALGNFRSLVQELQSAAAAHANSSTQFHPVVIGVTWPSTGFPTIPATDFGIKANDADEVGAVWMNALINEHLRQLKQTQPFKLVVIGHSFGARATSRGAFSAALLGQDERRPTVDLLIGLQGAYSYQRYLLREDGLSPEGREGAPYRDFPLGARTVALTASRHDTAVTLAGHADFFVGSMDAYRRSAAGAHADRFIYAQAGADGTLPSIQCGPDRITWIDASAVIKTAGGNSRSGAHSDIYTPEIGRMTYSLIRACAW